MLWTFVLEKKPTTPLRHCKRLRALTVMIRLRSKIWFKTSFGHTPYFGKYCVQTGYQAFKLGSHCSLDVMVLPETFNTVQSINNNSHRRIWYVVIGKRIFREIWKLTHLIARLNRYPMSRLIMTYYTQQNF